MPQAAAPAASMVESIQYRASGSMYGLFLYLTFDVTHAAILSLSGQSIVMCINLI